MAKVFNTTAVCVSDKHYMVNIDKRLEEIKKLIDSGKYFTICRARQYGKSTTLRALYRFLQKEYYVILMDFQTFDYAKFENGNIFSITFAKSFLKELKRNKLVMNEKFEEACKNLERCDTIPSALFSLKELFEELSDICSASDKSVVLMIDEVDSAANNQVFIDFLSQLRAQYINRDMQAVLHAVVLTGVYDIKNLKQKLRPEDAHKYNSPWNTRESNEENGCLHTFDECTRNQIALVQFDSAADFKVEMSFSKEEIAGMLYEYEADYHTGMDIDEIAGMIYEYTSGYPYLVSGLCKYIDEVVAGTDSYPDKKSAWTMGGFQEAVKLLMNDNNVLYQSLTGKLTDYPMLKTVLYELLFTGKPIPYVPQNQYIDVAAMFGFIKNNQGMAVISNRIFETVLYNLFISEEYSTSRMYDAGVKEKNQFVADGHLNVRRVLEKFVETFDALYGDADETFLEDAGRRYFMLFLKPIINGAGNCYVEAQTRNRERMDLVIDYRGEQSIIEMKVWRENAYHERGERQIGEYLDYFHLKKGYMLSFNFNKKKEVGVKEIVMGDKVLVEAVV